LVSGVKRNHGKTQEEARRITNTRWGARRIVDLNTMVNNILNLAPLITLELDVVEQGVHGSILVESNAIVRCTIELGDDGMTLPNGGDGDGGPGPGDGNP
jgi:hypothetical protein